MTVSKIRLPDNTEHDIRAKYLVQSTSADAVSEEFVTRTSTQDGVATIQKIYGNTVKWNQMLTAQYLSVTVSGAVSAFSSQADGTYAITLSTAATAVINTTNTFSRFFTAGHKYYIRNNSSNLNYLVLRCPLVGDYSLQSQIVSISSTFDETSSNNNFRFRIKSGAPAGTYTIRPWVVDLTLIYGAGNEPTSVDDFEAEFPYDYYPYSPQTLLSNSATAILSKDSGDNVIGRCDLNIPTLTGKLNGTGSSVVVFPNGMQLNGTTRDELMATTAVKRIANDNSVLATPEEYILDNSLQLQYPVVAGGTEMVLPTTGTAPMKMDVIYGNAADAVANLPQNYISADSMKEFLSVLGTQMGGTWSMGYQDGKHKFTFTSS